MWYFKRGVSYLLFLIGAVGAALAVFGIFKMLKMGLTYACVGQGCPYQTPQAVPWIYFTTVGLPISIFAFVGWFLLRRVSQGGPTPALGPVANLPSAGTWQAATAGAWQKAPLTSSYEPNEPGPSPSLGKDLMTHTRFHAAFHAQYLGTAIFELILGSGFLVGAIYSPAVRFGWGLTAVILLGVGFGLLYASVRSGRRVADAHRLAVEGIHGTAQIVGLTQTGMYVNNQPMIGIEALIQVPGKAPYRIKKRELVPLVGLGEITVGSTTSVVVDPNDANKVLFSWDMG